MCGWGGGEGIIYSSGLKMNWKRLVVEDRLIGNILRILYNLNDALDILGRYYPGNENKFVVFLFQVS